MIKQTLITLTELLTKHIGADIIQIGNVSILNNESAGLESNNCITVSVVNIEEEKTLRNISNFKYESATQPRQQPQLLIVSVLFCACQKNNHSDNYLDGLENLENIKAFFQANPVVETKHATEYVKVVSEFITQNNEQLDHMWSYLGVKYMPSLLYKLKILVQGSSTQ